MHIRSFGFWALGVPLELVRRDERIRCEDSQSNHHKSVKPAPLHPMSSTYVWLSYSIALTKQEEQRQGSI